MSKAKTFKKPVMIKMDDELLGMLELWENRQEHKPNRSQVLRDLLRTILVEKLKAPPGRSARSPV